MEVEKSERKGLVYVRNAIYECEFPEKVRKILLKAKFQKVEVYQDHQKWELHFLLPQNIDYSYIQKLNKQLTSKLSGPEITLRPHYVQDPEKKIEDFSKQVSEILEETVGEFPSLAGWLKTTKWCREKNRLFLYVNDFVGEKLFRKKNIPLRLQEQFEHKIGVKLEVLIQVRTSNRQTKNMITESHFRLKRVRAIKAEQESSVYDHVLKGHHIAEKPEKISRINSSVEKIVLMGKVFEHRSLLLKNDSILVIFNITDLYDSITVKTFEKTGSLLLPGGKLQEGSWVMVRGPVIYDTYQKELVVKARDICLCEPPARKDKALEKRVELHLHTKMSAMDGLTNINELMKQVAEWGHPAVAVTDHGVVQAFPDAYKAARKHGVKLIYGMEGYLVDNLDPKSPQYHVILLAKNRPGLLNLYRLVSKSHLNHFYRKPRILRNELINLRVGLLVGSACVAGELVQLYLKGVEEEKLLECASFYDYLEIQPLANNEFLLRNGSMKSREELVLLNQTILQLGEKLRKKVVATGDVHFLNPEDAIYRSILLDGQGYEDEAETPLYYRTTEEMLKEFIYLGEETSRKVVITWPCEICDQIEELQPIPDNFFPPEIEGSEDVISSRAWETAKKLYGDPLPEIVETRLVKELNAIIKNGYAVLYLIAQKLVEKSIQDGYLVGSRGSVGSSLVATLTGITEVNPLPPHYLCPHCHEVEFYQDGSVACGADLPDKNCPHCGQPFKKDGHDIPFETFLGFSGNKVPDIDLNFSGEYQNRAHRFAEELFGEKRIFRAGTITTIAHQTSFGFVKNYLEKKNLKPRQAEISRLVNGCTGVKRTTGQHPGGLMIVPQNLDIHEFSPLQHPADDKNSEIITTHFEYHAISDRLVKLDLLGHDDPTAIKLLEDLTGVDARKIPLDEPRTMSLFSGIDALKVKREDIDSTVGTLGIPEFGTRFVRQMLEVTRPKTFAELVRISGLSHGTEVWLNNAQELIRNGTAKLSQTIATRDDIMIYLIHQGLASEKAFEIMESVRKGKGIKPEWEQLMRQHGIPDWYIKSCNKIKYMFPKAHAVAYVMMAFRIAYFKVYHPLAFYATFFTIKAEEFETETIMSGKETVSLRINEILRKGKEATAKERNILTVLEVVREMYARGLAFSPISLSRSSTERFLIEGNKLLLPFSVLEGVGKRAAQNICKERTKKEFASVEELQIRAQLTKNVISALMKHGCLKGIPSTAQLELF